MSKQYLFIITLGVVDWFVFYKSGESYWLHLFNYILAMELRPLLGFIFIVPVVFLVAVGVMNTVLFTPFAIWIVLKKGFEKIDDEENQTK
tara:strand:- start:885 stop:1154 length:270 start_codon:yes stop_codon:yes gene_type:complete